MKLLTKYIRLIADYGPAGDLAFSEVEDRIDDHMKAVRVRFWEKETLFDYKLRTTPVAPLNSIENAFVTAQLAVNTPLGEDYIIYNNVAPRKDDKRARVKNAGEPFIYLRLKNGVKIVMVNSGLSATLLKPFAEEIRAVNVQNDETQFRSRDKYPSILPYVVEGREEEILGADVADQVPDHFPENIVVYTDGYGNLKTSMRAEEISAYKGQRLTVNVNGREHLVAIGEGIFSVQDGEFCLARGSSGWDLPQGSRLDFVELVKRGGSAAREHGKPPAGVKVRIIPPEE